MWRTGVCEVSKGLNMRVPRVVLGMAMIAVLLAACDTFRAAAADQLAVWAVTVGTSLAGYSPLIAKQANFLLLGGAIQDRDLRFAIRHPLALDTILAGRQADLELHLPRHRPRRLKRPA